MPGVRLKQPAGVDQVTLEEVDFAGHVIVCGFRASLAYFVAPLRLESLRSRPKIVIVAKDRHSDDDWEPLSVYPEVYFMKRDPPRFAFLVRAGIKRCSRVVVISDETLQPEEADAEAVLIAKNLQDEDDRVYEIVEIAVGAGMGHIGDAAIFSAMLAAGLTAAQIARNWQKITRKLALQLGTLACPQAA